MMGQDDWEYPFWVALGNEGGQTLRIEHINVTNVSNVKYDKDPFNVFSPCAVIVVSANPPGDVNFRGSNYLQKWFSNPVSVFMLK